MPFSRSVSLALPRFGLCVDWQVRFSGPSCYWQAALRPQPYHTVMNAMRMPFDVCHCVPCLPGLPGFEIKVLLTFLTALILLYTELGMTPGELDRHKSGEHWRTKRCESQAESSKGTSKEEHLTSRSSKAESVLFSVVSEGLRGLRQAHFVGFHAATVRHTVAGWSKTAQAEMT